MLLMSNQNRPIVVFGANGVQGAATARALLEQDSAVRVVTQRGSTSLPLRPIDQVVTVDFDEKDSLASALADASGAYLNLPVSAGPRSGIWLMNFLDAAKEAGLPRLVFEPRGAYPDFKTDVPMLEGIRALVDLALNSGIPTAVVKVSIYLDNLLNPWILSEMLQRQTLSYPLLADQRVGWGTAEDSGRLATSLLLQEKFESEAIDLWTSDDPTMSEIVEIIGHRLKKPLGYRSMPPEEFGAILSEGFGSEEVGREIAKLYAFSIAHPRRNPLQVPGRVIELGIKPMSTSEWVATQNWG